MTTKENCDLWMNYVYEEWLDGLARQDRRSYLRGSTKNMVKRMREAVESKKTEEAWNLLERLKRLNEGFDSEARIEKYKYEKPESYMECARTAYDLGDLRTALELFHVATGYFHNSTYKAVCYWMAGCVQWQLPSRSEAAVLSWERSKQLMDDVGSEKLDYITDPILKGKYIKAIENMEDAIDKATGDGIPHPPPSVAGDSASASSTSTRTKSESASSASNVFSTHLKFLPYFGSIPAGDPVSALQHPDGEVGVNSLEIDGRMYRIVGVRNEREVRMPGGSDYFLMKAKGNSMNNANPVSIENGDYVLLKNTQQAQSNDIVAAVVFGPGEPETATLKRYHEDGSGRFLMSESLTETINIRMSGGDYVQGVALVVLKLLND